MAHNAHRSVSGFSIRISPKSNVSPLFTRNSFIRIFQKSWITPAGSTEKSIRGEQRSFVEGELGSVHGCRKSSPSIRDDATSKTESCVGKGLYLTEGPFWAYKTKRHCGSGTGASRCSQGMPSNGGSAPSRRSLSSCRWPHRRSGHRTMLSKSWGCSSFQAALRRARIIRMRRPPSLPPCVRWW